MSNSKAKYYIYRNLTKGGFSVKYRGKVIDHAESIEAIGVQFRVSEKGRLRVIKEGKKYVHAYVVCDSYSVLTNFHADIILNGACSFETVKYNPFKYSAFHVQGWGFPATSKGVLLTRSQVFTQLNYLSIK